MQEFTGLRRPLETDCYVGQLLWFSTWEDQCGQQGQTYFFQSIVFSPHELSRRKVAEKVKVFFHRAQTTRLDAQKWFDEWGVAQRGRFYDGDPYYEGWEVDEDGWCGMTLFTYDPMYQFSLSPLEVDFDTIYRRCLQDLAVR